MNPHKHGHSDKIDETSESGKQSTRVTCKSEQITGWQLSRKRIIVTLFATKRGVCFNGAWAQMPKTI